MSDLPDNSSHPAGPAPAATAPVFRYRMIDSRPPFQDLAYYHLPATPRPGDHINIGISTGKALFRVDFVNFEPNLEYPILVGCSPFSAKAADQNQINSKQRMDDVVKWQLQILDKGLSFSNAMIVAGYAGLFGLWAFAKPQLSTNCSLIVALLLGTSLLIYVTWELFAMIVRAISAQKFVKLIQKTPEEFFNLFAQQEKDDQLMFKNISTAWKFVVITAGLTAYGGGLLLLYNCLAHLIHLREWP